MQMNVSEFIMRWSHIKDDIAGLAEFVVKPLQTSQQ